MNSIKLETVVVDNGLGGAIAIVEEDDILSGEVILMQRTYTCDGTSTIEETRFARLIDDVSRMVLHEFKPGRILQGDIVMKQRIGYAPGYTKIKQSNGRLLRDHEGNPVWGRTYYTEDEEDRDDLIVSSISR